MRRYENFIASLYIGYSLPINNMRPLSIWILGSSLLADVPTIGAFQPVHRSARASRLHSSPGDDAQPVEWGVSFIGGDPCGSKYNDDPFDAQVQKPGMPDDMKARIAALAAKKLQQEDEEKSSDRDKLPN